jgi:hypothetical protein
MLSKSAAKPSPEAALAFSGDPATEVVTAESGNVGLRKAADMLGVHFTTLARRADEFGATRDKRGALVFEVERLRIATSRGGARKAVQADAAEGERDARVVAMLQEGKTIADIVVAAKVPLRIVVQLRVLWLESLNADQQGVVHVCQGCRMKPGNPTHSFCSDCGPHAHVLTPEQLAALKETKKTP